MEVIVSPEKSVLYSIKVQRLLIRKARNVEYLAYNCFTIPWMVKCVRTFPRPCDVSWIPTWVPSVVLFALCWPSTAMCWLIQTWKRLRPRETVKSTMGFILRCHRSYYNWFKWLKNDLTWLWYTLTHGLLASRQRAITCTYYSDHSFQTIQILLLDPVRTDQLLFFFVNQFS